jgi:hypothetical protein
MTFKVGNGCLEIKLMPVYFKHQSHVQILSGLYQMVNVLLLVNIGSDCFSARVQHSEVRITGLWDMTLETEAPWCAGISK